MLKQGIQLNYEKKAVEQRELFKLSKKAVEQIKVAKLLKKKAVEQRKLPKHKKAVEKSKLVKLLKKTIEQRKTCYKVCQLKYQIICRTKEVCYT